MTEFSFLGELSLSVSDTRRKSYTVFSCFLRETITFYQTTPNTRVQRATSGFFLCYSLLFGKNNHSFSVKRIGWPAVFTGWVKIYYIPSLYKKSWCINSMAIFVSIRTVALTAVDSNVKCCLLHRILALNVHLCKQAYTVSKLRLLL